ncbi:hypothetical protein J4E91_010542 [Alternaria rosae]|nr:hypothetical protein J4E91_010542 [Alternaria rosae]
MSWTPNLEHTLDEHLNQAVQDELSAAGEGGAGGTGQNKLRFEYEGASLPYTTACSVTLEEDARALLGGSIDDLLKEERSLAGDAAVALQAYGQHLAPSSMSLPQLLSSALKDALVLFVVVKSTVAI